MTVVKVDIDERMAGWQWHDDEDELNKNLETINRYADDLVAFKELADQASNVPEDLIEDFGEKAFEEQDWYDMSIGFFIGRGLDWSTAVDLALISRYKFEYWC